METNDKEPKNPKKQKGQWQNEGISENKAYIERNRKRDRKWQRMKEKRQNLLFNLPGYKSKIRKIEVGVGNHDLKWKKEIYAKLKKEKER